MSTTFKTLGKIDLNNNVPSVIKKCNHKEHLITRIPDFKKMVMKNICVKCKYIYETRMR